MTRKLTLMLILWHLIQFNGAFAGNLDDLYVEGTFQVGHALPKYQFTGYLSEHQISGVSVGIFKQSQGSKPIHATFKYPQYGLSWFYANLGNRKEFGYETGLLWNFGLDLLTLGKVNLNGMLGLGLNYYSGKYNIQTNNLNLSSGSSINAHLKMTLNLKYEISKRNRLGTGLVFDHFSNGGTRQPNLGLNYVSIDISYARFLGSISERSTMEKQVFTKKFYCETYFGFGFKQPYSSFANTVNPFSMSFETKRPINRIIHLGLGVDLSHDPSILREQSVDRTQTGLHISESFVHKNFVVEFQQGFYLGLKHQAIPRQRYSKTILKYYIHQNVAIRMAIKSHNLVADFPEIGIGFKL